jgi:hypothetical protein
MVLSCTHRYRKKYVTTLLYKPIWGLKHGHPQSLLLVFQWNCYESYLISYPFAVRKQKISDASKS